MKSIKHTISMPPPVTLTHCQWSTMPRVTENRKSPASISPFLNAEPSLKMPLTHALFGSSSYFSNSMPGPRQDSTKCGRENPIPDTSHDDSHINILNQNNAATLLKSWKSTGLIVSISPWRLKPYDWRGHHSWVHLESHHKTCLWSSWRYLRASWGPLWCPPWFLLYPPHRSCPFFGPHSTWPISLAGLYALLRSPPIAC